MKHREALENHNRILSCLNHLPKKMITLHEWDNVPEFVLHEFCHEGCFNLDKAAYFVDNPDFDCLKGVAGVCKCESGYCENIPDVWKEPEKYSEYMRSHDFNAKVRNIVRASMKDTSISQEERINQLAKELGINNPEYHRWNMKHDNQGILIYQKSESCAAWDHDHLSHGVYLLSFCPIH